MTFSLKIAEDVDYWGLEYLPNPLLEQLICPICQTVLVDACSTKCGHTFCRKCITDAIELYDRDNPDDESRPFRCPVDRQALNGLGEIRPSAFLITSLINELVVRCPFKARGCDFQGKRWVLQKHLDHDCLYTMVKCGGVKNNGTRCQELVERGTLLKYLRELGVMSSSTSINGDNKHKEETEESIKIFPNTSENRYIEGRLNMDRDYVQHNELDHNEQVCEETQTAEQNLCGDLDSQQLEQYPQEQLNIQSQVVENTKQNIISAQVKSGDNSLFQVEHGSHIQSKNITTPNDNNSISSSSSITTMRKCLHESMLCPNGCGSYISPDHLEEHYKKTCSNIFVQCLSCREIMCQAQLPTHENECLERLVECHAKHFGCTWVGKRKDIKDLQKHLSECLFMSLSPVLSQQEQRIDKLEEENAVLRSHVERLSSQGIANCFSDEILSSSSTDSIGASNVNFLKKEDILRLMLDAQKLRLDVDYIITTIGEMDIKQSMVMMRENVRIQEELGLLRNGFNNLRSQVHFLLAERRSWSMIHHGISSNNHSDYIYHDGQVQGQPLQTRPGKL